MRQLNNRLLTVAIVVFIVTTLAFNGAVRTFAQTASPATSSTSHSSGHCDIDIESRPRLTTSAAP